jgi:hypothetical protein
MRYVARWPFHHQCLSSSTTLPPLPLLNSDAPRLEGAGLNWPHKTADSLLLNLLRCPYETGWCTVRSEPLLRCPYDTRGFMLLLEHCWGIHTIQDASQSVRCRIVYSPCRNHVGVSVQCSTVHRPYKSSVEVSIRYRTAYGPFRNPVEVSVGYKTAHSPFRKSLEVLARYCAEPSQSLLYSFVCFTRASLSWLHNAELLDGYKWRITRKWSWPELVLLQ